jgi:hypothetical protein
MRQKSHRSHAASQDLHLKSGITADFDHNAVNGIAAFEPHIGRYAPNFRLEIRCRR